MCLTMILMVFCSLHDTVKDICPWGADSNKITLACKVNTFRFFCLSMHVLCSPPKGRDRPCGKWHPTTGHNDWGQPTARWQPAGVWSTPRAPHENRESPGEQCSGQWRWWGGGHGYLHGIWRRNGYFERGRTYGAHKQDSELPTCWLNPRGELLLNFFEIILWEMFTQLHFDPGNFRPKCTDIICLCKRAAMPKIRLTLILTFIRFHHSAFQFQGLVSWRLVNVPVYPFVIQWRS